MKPSRFLQVFLPLLLVAATVAFLYEVRGALLPFVLSILLAHSANPLLKWLELRDLRRGAAIALLYLGILALFGSVGYFGVRALRAQVSDLQTRVPEFIERTVRVLETKKVGSFEAGAKLVRYIEEHKEDWGKEALGAVPELTAGVVEVALYFFLVPFISFFIMASAPHLLRSFVNICPGRHVERLLNLIWALDETIGRYIRGLIVEASLVGLVTFAGLWMIGMDYAAALSLLVAAANVIPVLGLLVGGVPAVVLAFIQFETLAGAAKALGVFAVAKLLDDFAFQPMIMGRAVHVHPVLVLFALDCGLKLGGLLGVIFAVPVACIIRLFLETAFEWYKTEYGLESPPEFACASVADPPLL